MATCKNHLDYKAKVQIFVPAETWQNVINCGRISLKLYSVYVTLGEPQGAIHKTKEIDQH